MLWDLNEAKHLYTLDGGGAINALCFSPNRYWLCAATGPSIKIWVSIQGLLTFNIFRFEIKICLHLCVLCNLVHNVETIFHVH